MTASDFAHVVQWVTLAAAFVSYVAFDGFLMTSLLGVSIGAGAARLGYSWQSRKHKDD